MSWTNLIGPALSVAAGFAGQRKKKLPSEVRRIYNFQYSLADQLRRQAQSTPLSQNYERQSLAQARGELGQQQMAQREQLFSGYNPDTMGQSRNDLELSLTNEQIGQNLSLESQHYLNALQYRRGLYQDAARTAAGATPTAASYGAGTEQENGLNQMLGALSKGWSTYQASQQAKTQGAEQSTRQQDYEGWFKPGGSGGVPMPGQGGRQILGPGGQNTPYYLPDPKPELTMPHGQIGMTPTFGGVGSAGAPPRGRF